MHALKRVSLSLLLLGTACASPRSQPPTGNMEGLDQPSVTADKQAMQTMHEQMMIAYTGNPDIDFARGMVPHHQGAVAMARIELQYGTDPKMRSLARRIIASQQKEIAFMNGWLENRPQ